MKKYDGVYDFFAAEGKKLSGYVKSKFRGSGDTAPEDIIGDVMLGIFNRKGNTVPVQNLSAYVYRCIRNRINDIYREKEGVHIESLEGDEDNLSPALMLTDNITALDGAERKELKEKLYAAVNSLKPEYRAVFVATEIRHIPYKALAEKWNEPVGTLLSRKNRAVKELRKMLKDYKD